MLPLQGVWVQSLVRELRSPMPCGMAKNIKIKNEVDLWQQSQIRFKVEEHQIFFNVIFSVTKMHVYIRRVENILKRERRKENQSEDCNLGDSLSESSEDCSTCYRSF